MDKLCGQSGVVKMVDFDDDVRVLFDEKWAQKKNGKFGMAYCFHPDALNLVEKSAAATEWPSLATLMAAQPCALTSTEAKAALEQEAEDLLLRAMQFLGDDAGDNEESGSSAVKCTELLIALYVKQVRA